MMLKILRIKGWQQIRKQTQMGPLFSKVLGLCFMNYYLQTSSKQTQPQQKPKKKKKEKILPYIPFKINLREFKKQTKKMTYKITLTINNKKLNLIFVKSSRKDQKINCFINQCSYGGCHLQDELINGEFLFCATHGCYYSGETGEIQFGPTIFSIHQQIY